MSRLFNIAGPCLPTEHYMLPVWERLHQVQHLIQDESYFVVHAPRQCGKTTAFRQLMYEINRKEEYCALYCSLEAAQNIVEPEQGVRSLCDLIRYAVSLTPCLSKKISTRELTELAQAGDYPTAITRTLGALAQKANHPLVVFFDEVDCLSDATLISFLRQLRLGRISQPETFPVSIALIGMRNIRDYRAHIRPYSESLGSASPFNVITETSTLSNFSLEEICQLYKQHTDETHQVFEEGVVEQVYEYTCGQPYLVNALARWCVEKIHQRHYHEPITCQDMHDAKEKIIRERGTHLDSLMERMKEDRVRRIIEPLLLGETISFDAIHDDYLLVKDLGLIKEEGSLVKPANPMYAEVMGRYLSWGLQQDLLMQGTSRSWIQNDESLDMPSLMASFQQFWRENAQVRSAPFHYSEAYAQLVLQAFLQRVINGGGEIIREMALGKCALDLCVIFRNRKYAIECKRAVRYAKSPSQAHEQVAKYMDSLGLNEGWLVVFDSDLTKPWDEKISHKDLTFNGKMIHIIRC